MAESRGILLPLPLHIVHSFMSRAILADHCVGSGQLTLPLSSGPFLASWNRDEEGLEVGSRTKGASALAACA